MIVGLMPRQVRIEYEGAFYHVMARGHRRDLIFQDDADRETFLRILGVACEKSGFRVHAYVLMSNHYHLLLETPQANLSRGMGWLQNAFTRRMNVRHRLWGHLFGGRYKAILAEPGNCFWALLDYIHLNPVRAGMVKEKKGIESYEWSSLRHYLEMPRKRPKWVEAARGLEVCGCHDTASGRKEFLKVLEKRVDWRNPGKAGATFAEGEGKPELAVHSALRRGWFFGSQKFREKLLKLLKKRDARIQKAHGYHGPQLHDYGEERARALIRAGLEHFAMDAEELKRARKGDWRKGLLAAMIQGETTMRLDWISEQLSTGTRSGTCRLASEMRRSLKSDRKLQKSMESITRMSILNG